MDKYPEKMMSVRYLKGDEKVLELEGNIGRNSLIIASTLNNNNLVTMEWDKEICEQLLYNKNKNFI
jgi:hypothetical protein